MVRALPPYSGNTKKRLVKSPKVYIRDTGILHTLLNIETMEDLFSHPVYGVSYEGYVIENILTRFPRWRASFYRTANNAEIDLILEKGLQKIAVEIKASTTPKVSRRFYNCIQTIAPDRTVVIAPVATEYPIADKVMVMPINVFLDQMD